MVKFIYKIISCPYFQWWLLSSAHKHKSRSIDCLCNCLHQCFLLACRQHSFVYPLRTVDCYCTTIIGPLVCESCIKKQLAFNHHTIEVCRKILREVSDGVIIDFDKYLNQIKSEPFFGFKRDTVFCCLENYDYEEIIGNFVLNPGN